MLSMAAVVTTHYSHHDIYYIVVRWRDRTTRKSIVGTFSYLLFPVAQYIYIIYVDTHEYKIRSIIS